MAASNATTTAGKTGITAAVLAVAAAPLVAYWEGVVPYTYADPVWGWSVPTACAGETGPHIRRGQTFTVAECMAMLDRRLVADWPKVERCIQQPLRVNEAVAVASLAHNVGTSAVCKSTMVRQINAGEPASVWCAQFDRWIYANGQAVRGLVRRRAAERAVCEGNAT